MSLSKVTLFTLATLTVISTLVAKLQNIVHVSNDIEYDDIKKQIEDDVYPDSSLKHTIWFLQISDLHLSLFHDPHRGPDLKRFCTETVSNIKPFVVLATGDLVDSRTQDLLGSEQFIEEWKMYQNILQESAVTNMTTWLDIRGNHDNFNVLTSDDQSNFFRKYSIQGGHHRRSYKYTLLHDSESYDFIGIDACMNPGPKRPFNFLGVLQKDEYAHIQSLREEAKGNVTIWFGHYPTSTIIAPYPGARELMRSSGPYLCGHLHTFGGMVPHMYTLQSTGNLELELADWKDNRKYRLCAIDHGLFSFFDNDLEDWPAILITNPKDAMMTMPIEPLYRILKSTHIRVLIFSQDPIQVAKVQIDGEVWRELNATTLPLFVTTWEPLQYMEGLHTITVYARDRGGHENTVTHQFSLDGTRPRFPLGARLVLMGHISVGQAVFGISLLLTLLPLCILKICLCFGKGQTIKMKSELNFVRRWIFKLSLLASVDVVFWPVVIAALYVAVGPWFVGYIIDSTIGVCFVWGIFLGGTFLPGGLTYFAGTLYDRNAVVDKRQLWERGVVPFVEDPGLNKTVIRWVLQRAFDQYQKNTCIKFIPRTTERDYIRLFPGQGCYSNVGKTGGSQPVSLGENCGWEGAIVHELGHAIGFYHEQNRSDRDKYIRILWQNIRAGKEDQFFLLKPHQNQLLTSFDYESIMLYGSLTFSKDWRSKLRTMETLDGGWLKDPMSKGKLSRKDVERINMLYKCP